MARIAHGAQSEIDMDYENLPDAPARRNARRSGSGKDAAVPGRKVYRLVAVSFGLLCVLQALLNFSLRLALYNKPPDKEASCANLTEGTVRLINFDEYFQQGWVHFRSSLYYISSTKKSRQESRADCLQRGGDLVIINSIEEKNFTEKFVRRTWIGLMLTTSEKTLPWFKQLHTRWEWVDGTPLTKSYWAPGEPNSLEGNNENCAEIVFFDFENKWNDMSCEIENFWICEKMIAS